MSQSFTTFWSGGRQFASEDDIRSRVRIFRDYDDDDLAAARLLLLFETSRQHTWLVATNKRLYCVLDDARKDHARVQWSLRKSELKNDTGTLTVEISSADRRKNSGVVHIGPRRNWLYSKKLFRTEAVEDAVNKLIQRM